MKRIRETREVERNPACGFNDTYTVTIEQEVEFTDKAEADRASADYPSLSDWCKDQKEKP